MSSKKFSLILIITIILTLGLSISLGSLLAAWTAPTATAPDNNIAAPINISNTGQSKQGGLILNTFGMTNGLIVQSGNVGIGTDNPGAKLDVAGNINASGNISAAAPTASGHLATKGYIDNAVAALGSSGSEYVQGNAVYFTDGGNNYYCSQRSVDSGGMVTNTNVNENQPCDIDNYKWCYQGECSVCGGGSANNNVSCGANFHCDNGECVANECITNNDCAGANNFCNNGWCEYCRWVWSYDCGPDSSFYGYVSHGCAPVYEGTYAGYFTRHGSVGTWTSLYGSCDRGVYDDAAQYLCTCD